jgi:hypothetical protein
MQPCFSSGCVNASIYKYNMASQDVELKGDETDHVEEDLERGTIERPLLQKVSKRRKNIAIFIICLATFICISIATISLILSITVRVINSMTPTGCHEVPSVFTNTPATYLMTKDLISGQFYITQDGNSTIAHMKHRQYSFPYAIDLMDRNSESISVGMGGFFNLGSSISISHCSSKSVLNALKQKPKIAGTEYEILSPNLKVATNVVLDGLFTLHFAIMDSSGTSYGTIRRHFSVPEKWTIELQKNHPEVDNQIYFYLAAIISYSSDQ